VNNKRRRRGRWVLVWVSVSASVAFSTEKDTVGIWSKDWEKIFYFHFYQIYGFASSYGWSCIKLLHT